MQTKGIPKKLKGEKSRLIAKLTDTDKEFIRAFADNNMNISETARKLYTHRNTAVYHLDQVAKVCGLNPRIFWDLVTLLDNI